MMWAIGIGGFVAGWGLHGILTAATTRIMLRILAHPAGKAKILEAMTRLEDKENGQQ